MAVCQAARRCGLAVLVRSYKVWRFTLINRQPCKAEGCER